MHVVVTEAFSLRRLVRVSKCGTAWLAGAVAAASVCLGAAAPTRIPIRPTPKPGEVIHVTTQQEIVMRMGEKPEEPGPAQLHTRGLLAFTQSNGRVDEQNHLEAGVVVERMEIEDATKSWQGPGMDPNSVKGRSLAVVFDRSGKLLTIKVPPDIAAPVSSKLTQLLAGAYGPLNFLPAVSLAVGEETSSTSDLPMRLPGNLSQGPLQAKVNLTLRALDRNGRDRIAHIQQRIDVVTETRQLTMSGGGTIDANLDRGFVSSNETEWTISGSIPPAAGKPQSPPFFVSFKVSVSAN